MGHGLGEVDLPENIPAFAAVTGAVGGDAFFECCHIAISSVAVCGSWCRTRSAQAATQRPDRLARKRIRRPRIEIFLIVAARKRGSCLRIRQVNANKSPFQ